MYLRTIKRLIAIFIIVLACVIPGFNFDPIIQEALADTKSITFNIPHNISINDTDRTFFYDFAWQTFVGLNWPSDCDGQPLKNIQIGQKPNAPRVWEFYKLPEKIFIDNSNQPTGIACQIDNSGAKLQKEIGLKIATRQSVPIEVNLTEFGKIAEENPVLDEKGNVVIYVQEPPLVDQKGNYVISEIRINPEESEQIIQNQWYKLEKLQQDFINNNQLFNFVCSENNHVDINGQICKSRSGAGAIEIKAAWRVFDQLNSEEKARYFTTKRKLTIPKDISSTGQELTQEVDVGLIGFHIMQKTSNNGWIWSTFEHIDNAPPCDSPELSQPPNTYTLFNTQCEGANCKKNYPYTQSPYLWRNEAPHAVTRNGSEIKNQVPSQICRQLKLASNDKLVEVNHKWQKELKTVPTSVPNSSVWQYYQLIGAQWLLDPKVPYSTDIRTILPTKYPNLVNVALEPFKQDSSCIKCHTLAKLRNSEVYADFSYLMMDKELIKKLKSK